MNRSATALVLSAIALVLVATASCSDDDDECCPVSESFSCSNFDIGGARSLQANGQCQLGYSDNLLVSTKAVDAKGCTYWKPTGGITCNVGTGDGGVPDASGDASDEAAADAGDAGTEAGDATPP